MNSFLESLQNVFDWLKGRKTVVTIIALGGSATLQSTEVITLPFWVYGILGTLAVIFLKMAMNRIEAQNQPLQPKKK